jgi:N-acetylglutamate synthase-like GNAT family acetyltransferase
MKPMEPVSECTVFEQQRGEFTVSTDLARMDIDVIHGYLARAYWSSGIPREIVERAVQHSLCFGLFEGETQIGFARAVTDSTTFAYICDVFVLESHQGKGLGTWLMECVMQHPDMQGLRRCHLVTRDAHTLYEKVGFRSISKPERHMERTTPAVLNF